MPQVKQDKLSMKRILLVHFMCQMTHESGGTSPITSTVQGLSYCYVNWFSEWQARVVGPIKNARMSSQSQLTQQ
jgi:hypothetical protein